MDRLKQRVMTAERALVSLEELASISSPTKIERDAAVQRFEYTFEACWKAAQRYLLVVEGIDSGSPKDVIRQCRAVGILSDKLAVRGLEMVDDRNLTVHTYNESLAQLILSRIPTHTKALRTWIDAVRLRVRDG
jgi:nucleotidyltransferase substrate binding protein (TIGR01987 family)